MPVALTPLGNTVDAVIVDDNFSTLEDLQNSGILGIDIVGSYDRYRIRKYTSGKLVGVQIVNHPFLTQKDAGGADTLKVDTAQSRYKFDMTYRKGTEDPTNRASMDAAIQQARGDCYAMELLGSPGPSFIYLFQEEGRNAPTAAAGWPPAGWPVSRYPADKCYSRWVTVPGATTREYIPEPSTIRIRATARVGANMTRLLMDPINILSFYNNLRAFNLQRFGLFVDTNPTLSTDFPNTNPNIISQATGLTAPYVSWKRIVHRTFYMGQRSTIHLEGEVHVLGGKEYNLSLKTRDAQTNGWVDMNGGAPGTWRDTWWERANIDFPGSPNAPVYDANWTGTIVDMTQYAFGPSFVSLWENSSLSISIQSGRGSDYVDDSSDVDFSVRP